MHHEQVEPRQRRLQEYPADRPVRVAADELDDEPAALLAAGATV